MPKSVQHRHSFVQSRCAPVPHRRSSVRASPHRTSCARYAPSPRRRRRSSAQTLEPTALLTVLRSPVYLGKVFFRDALHDARHEHLVDEKLSNPVQALLSERGEDYSKRASATSPFPLAGLVVCARCGEHFVGTSAMGNRYRYRYYKCFSRQRYGTSTATPSASRQKSWTRPSSTPCSTSTSGPTSSTRPSQPPGVERAPSGPTTTRSWSSSTPGSRSLPLHIQGDATAQGTQPRRSSLRVGLAATGTLYTSYLLGGRGCPLGRGPSPRTRRLRIRISVRPGGQREHRPHSVRTSLGRSPLPPFAPIRAPTPLR